MSKFLKIVEETYEQLDEAAPKDPLRDINTIVGAIGTLENLYGKEEKPTSAIGKVVRFVDPKARKVKELKKKLDNIRATAGPILLQKIEKQIADLTTQLNQPTQP